MNAPLTGKVRPQSAKTAKTAALAALTVIDALNGRGDYRRFSTAC
jgi:hypothetical protein